MPNPLKILFLTFLIWPSPGPLRGQDQSVLSNGEWFKVGITESGIYKIDVALLGQLGIDALNPSDFHLYGNGQGMLPQQNSAVRPTDLTNIPLLFVGDEDESLEADEFFLFYGNSPHHLYHDGFDWYYEHNIYTDTSYYFITLGDQVANRIITETVSITPNETLESDQSVIIYSPEETNLLDYVNSGGSGREWYGDLLIPSTGLVKNYTFETPNLIDSLIVTVDVIGFSESQTSMDVILNEQPIGNLQINASTVSTYSPKGKTKREVFHGVSNRETQDISIDFIRSDGSIYGFINQILVAYDRELIYTNTPLLVNNRKRTHDAYEINVKSSKALHAWDISDVNNPKALSTFFNNGRVRFLDSAVNNSDYVIFDPQEITSLPIPYHRVYNQNIRSYNPRDGLIVSAPEFVNEAAVLADFHRNVDGLDVAVVTTREIYNEFSSGMQDVTAIRDAIRHYYDKQSSFRYVLLFGDCSFDYKDRVKDNTNFVPIYQSRNSWDPVLSYSSDDFYGFMDEEEGFWRESFSGDHDMEIGIGRLPVKSRSEADLIINKIIKYTGHSAKNNTWKNQMTYVVDDGNAGQTDTHIHMEDAEAFTDFLWSYQPQTRPNKLYIDAFPQEIDGGFESSSSVRKQLKEAIENGTFMVNFIGHGSEQRWTEETVLDHAFIRELSNVNRLPFFVTATCEFGRYDDPTLITEKSESGAEKLLLKQEGGAIGLITTTRPVLASSNYNVNWSFHNYFMRPLDDGPEKGRLPRLGDIIRLTKNNSQRGAINRNFALLGDPMLRLDYPDLKITLESINGKSIGEAADTLKALEHITLEGIVTDYEGKRFANYEGVIDIILYDTYSEQLTLGQRDEPFPFKVRNNVLFHGQASIHEGQYQISFVMPKNISYKFEKGSLSLNGYSPTLDMDATGGFNNLLVGGSTESAENDLESPSIILTVDKQGFETGGVVSQSDTILAIISDQSGINTSGLGINRDIILNINGDETTINHLYVADIDDYQNGKIRFPLSHLNSGSYHAELILFDLYNNRASATVDFIVSDQPTISLSDVQLYPNPATYQFSVAIDHPRINETLDMTMYLYSFDGKLAMKKEWVRTDFEGSTDDLVVDIDDRWLQNGLYYCKLTVQSRLDGAIGTAVRKLVIIN
jgi:hypothetical protein